MNTLESTILLTLCCSKITTKVQMLTFPISEAIESTGKTSEYESTTKKLVTDYPIEIGTAESLSIEFIERESVTAAPIIDETPPNGAAPATSPTSPTAPVVSTKASTMSKGASATSATPPSIPVASTKAITTKGAPALSPATAPVANIKATGRASATSDGAMPSTTPVIKTKDKGRHARPDGGAPTTPNHLGVILVLVVPFFLLLVIGSTIFFLPELTSRMLVVCGPFPCVGRCRAGDGEPRAINSSASQGTEVCSYVNATYTDGAGANEKVTIQGCPCD